jgi:hypothetical protein
MSAKGRLTKKGRAAKRREKKAAKRKPGAPSTGTFDDLSVEKLSVILVKLERQYAQIGTLIQKIRQSIELRDPLPRVEVNTNQE